MAKLGLPPLLYKREEPKATFLLMRSKETGDQWVSKLESDKTDPQFTGTMIPAVRFTVTGDHPHFEGWRLIGCLSPMEDCKSNVLMMVPGIERPVPEKYITCVGICEHCNKNRRRNETFLVEHMTTGEIKAVGRSCIEDFLGGKSPEQILQWGSFMFSLAGAEPDCDEIMENLPRVQPAYETRRFVAMCLRVIRRDGFTSKRKAEEVQTIHTSMVVEDCLYRVRIPGNQPIKLEDADYTEADECINWLKARPCESSNPDHVWNRNLVTLANQEGTLGRHSGIFCAGVNQWLNWKANGGDKVNNSKFVGTINVRCTFEVQLISITPIDNFYGTKYLHRFRTAEGCDIVWFSSGVGLENEDIGKQMRITGKVSNHNLYRGKQQTVLQRVKWEMPVTA